MDHYTPCTCDTGVFCQWTADLVFAHLIENASEKPPKDPVFGDLHFNLVTTAVHVFDGVKWIPAEEWR